MYFEQPDLQSWLNQLQEGKADKLATQLKNAWEAAQKKAVPLARLFMALSDFDFHYPLFAHVQPDPDDSHFQNALAAVILGDAPQKVRQALQTWLQQQGALDKNHSVFDTIEALKHRFTRAVTIYEPSYPPLGNTVHEWAKVLLREVLEKEPEPDILWHLLERARIGLNSLTMRLPPEWDKTLGKALWSALRKTIDEIGGGYVPDGNEPWLPIEIWLYQFGEWMENRPPTVEACQKQLQPSEALVQPFFDPVQQRLRVLWLDKNSLKMKELPDNAALDSLWLKQENVIGEWIRGLNELRNRNMGNVARDLEKVMESEPVQILADTLSEWAAELEQLTVIFPAPLGQLPWESLPQLEDKLVREISLARWLKSPSKSPSENASNQVICDPNGEKFCMIKEGQWVAKRWHTDLQSPCPSVFDALQALAHSKNVLLATHGIYKRNNPLDSALTLESKTEMTKEGPKEINKTKLPLWTISSTSVSAELVFLSACESNLNGQDTEGLLTPIGIGPTIAAAGAKTVIGILWSCDGLAALCFNYHFHRIADENPDKPWHQVVTSARQKLRDMTHQDLDEIIKEFEIEGDCYKSVEMVKAQSTASKKPFKKFHYWAGFTMLGETRRFNG